MEVPDKLPEDFMNRPEIKEQFRAIRESQRITAADLAVTITSIEENQS